MTQEIGTATFGLDDEPDRRTIRANGIVVDVIANDDGSVYVECYGERAGTQVRVDHVAIDSYSVRHPNFKLALAEPTRTVAETIGDARHALDRDVPVDHYKPNLTAYRILTGGHAGQYDDAGEAAWAKMSGYRSVAEYRAAQTGIADFRDAEFARWQAERAAIGAPEGTRDAFDRVQR